MYSPERLKPAFRKRTTCRNIFSPPQANPKVRLSANFCLGDELTLCSMEECELRWGSGLGLFDGMKLPRSCDIQVET